MSLRFVGAPVLLGLLAACAPSVAKIIPRRDPRDGALDATLVVIMRQEVQDTFRIEETFLGENAVGDVLYLPGFRLVVADLSTPFAGSDRVEPIQTDTRILVFLKPSRTGTNNWDVAGAGNCYFWSQGPGKLGDLYAEAKIALTLRKSWEVASSLPNERQRVEALWPYMWNNDGACFQQTKAVLRRIGSAAGDYMAEQWTGLSVNQKESLLWEVGEFRSERLHVVLTEELRGCKTAWEELVARGKFATYDEVDPPGRMHYNPRRPEDSEADEASDIYGILYYGFEGLASFFDRKDLPLVRESAMWGVKFRFKQLDDAALDAFGKMPDKANLPVIETVWKEYSRRPWVGNELRPVDVIRSLAAHRFPEAIPLMAEFVNVGFAQQEAQQFLMEMTGVDFGGDKKAWIDWYESHRRELGVKK